MIEEERMRDLEEKVTQLRITQGEFATSARHITTAVEELRKLVADLNNTMNRGRGALWMAMTAAGAFGAVLTTVVKRLFNLD